MSHLIKSSSHVLSAIANIRFSSPVVTLHNAMKTVHYTVMTIVHYIVMTIVHSTVVIVHCTLINVHSTVGIVLCTLYSVHIMFYLQQSVNRTLL